MNASVRNYMQRIQEFTGRLCTLELAMKKSYKELEKSHKRDREELEKAYNKALIEWKDAYGQLPGGFAQIYERLKAHEPDAIEAAIAFLLVDPYFFRSGYMKGVIAKFLKKAPLSKEQILLLQDFLMSAIQRNARQEYREYYRLGRKIADEAFCTRLRDFIKRSDNERHRMQAVRLLEIIST